MGSLTTSDLVLLGTALFLGVIALSVPYLSELIKRRLFAPKLVVYFKESPPGCHRTRIKGVAGGTTIDEPVFYFRFQVANEGKSQARKCEAVIENLTVADAAGHFSKDTTYTPVNLIWGASYGEYVEINPGRRYFCDLLHIPSTRYQELAKKSDFYVDPSESDDFDVGAILNVKAAFYAQPNRLPQGKYRIDIAIYSENADVVRQRFYVSWSGKWKDTEVGIFQELVIEPEIGGRSSA
jgi:hypothetical protein